MYDTRGGDRRCTCDLFYDRLNTQQRSEQISILDQLTANKPANYARMLCVHGGQGVGKTTFGAGCPQPALLPIEMGYRDIDFPMVFPLQTSFMQLYGTVMQLDAEESLPFKTLVIDSADWVEALIEQQLDDENFKRDYGRGVAEVGARFKTFLDALRHLNRKHNVMIVILSHSRLAKVELPTGGSYDQWQPKLSKKANEYLVEAVDEVGFAHHETIVRKENSGFKDRGVGVTTGRRMLSLTPSAAYVAKNRARQGVQVPENVELNFESYLELFYKKGE